MTEQTNQFSAGFRRLAAASAFAGLFSFALTVTVTPAALNQIKHYYHKSDAQVGWIFPVTMIGFFTCVLLGGLYSDRRGKLPVLVTGCALMALGAYAFSCATTYPIALVTLLIMGLGGGLTEAISMGVVAEVFSDDRRTSMMNCAQVFFAVGAVLGPFGIAWLIAARTDWRWAYVATAGFCLLAAGLATAAVARKEERRALAHEHGGDWRVLLNDRLLVAFAIGVFLYVSAETGQASWLAPYFRDGLGASSALAAATVAMFWGGIGAGRVTATWSSRYLSDYAIIVSSLSIALACQVALLVFHAPIPALITLPILGFGLAPVWPTIVSRASALHPNQIGTVLGIVVAAGAIGAGISPQVIGQAADIIGLRHALWVCPALLVTNLSLFIALWRRHRAR